MWNLPRVGIKPTSPALEGIFLTTGPPGKLPFAIFIQKQKRIHRIGESFEKAKKGSFPPKKGIATNLRDPARECLLTRKKRCCPGVTPPPHYDVFAKHAIMLLSLFLRNTSTETL